jgi:acetylornithine deacetylase/succinyl-diaminopimelate desuccinylase-like protein
MRKACWSFLAAGASLALLAPPAAAAPADGGEARFRAIYKELIETDTTLSAGDCTLAANRMRDRLIAAGYAGSQYRTIVPPNLPKQGNLIGEVAGSDRRLPAVLLLAHIDVVEARRSDWQRDPFILVEENGYFYGRGVIDDKAMAAAYVDALIRLRESGFRPKRTIKLALTCGEETPANFDGVRYLLEHEPEAMRAGFALNEGGRGSLDADGRMVSFGVQAGEKQYQDVTVVATAQGGHSARPVPDNAIARLGAAMARLNAYRFPVNVIPATKSLFAQLAKQYRGQTGDDLAAAGAGTPTPEQYERIAAADPFWNAYLRTTCIPTTIQGGHAHNAQPQHAEANINCRILPGETPQQTLDRLVAAIGDPSLKVTFDDPPERPSSPPRLTREVMAPIERIAAAMFPGVPVIPSLSTGATDGRFTTAAGIPTYGVTGLFGDPDGNGIHGLNERVRVSSLLASREFLYRLIRDYGSQ